MTIRTRRMLLRGLAPVVGCLVVLSIAIGAAAQGQAPEDQVPQDQVSTPSPPPGLGDTLATSLSLSRQTTPQNEEGVYTGTCGYFVEVGDGSEGYCLDDVVDHHKNPLAAWVLEERLRGHEPTADEQNAMASELNKATEAESK